MRRPSVLLVNSDTDTRRILQDALEHRGYDVLDAPTGAEGLEMASRHAPDVIIGDFPMDVPGHSPFAGDIRSQPQLADIKILVLTVRAMDHELQAAWAAGDDVLVKPVEPAKVVAAVERLLGRTGS